MDILRELSDDELKYIIEKFKADLPYGLKNLYYIYSAQICAKESQKYDWTFSTKVLPKFYTNRYGLKENCTIFGITGERDHTVWYFSYDESLNEIRECLEKTNLIKWRSGVLFVTVHAEKIQPLLEVVTKNDYDIIFNDENSYYFISVEDALNFDISIPPDVYVSQLEVKDAETCNNLWKYKYEESEAWIKTLIVAHGGYCLRDKNTHELLSISLITDHLAIGFLNTVEKAQRKGYGEVIVKYLARKIAEKGFMPHAYVNKDNIRANSLFSKLGFTKIGDTNWTCVKST